MSKKETNQVDLETLRHSTSHVMACAVKRLFPDVKIAIGPAIDDGFYYDFDLEHHFVPEDLQKIEKEMRRIIKRNVPFERKPITKKDAIKRFKDEGEVYKVELLEEIDDTDVNLYQSGDFTDLCRGPHITHSGQIKSFKLTSIAGAYWRGDEKKKMLQRIYGTAFLSDEDLQEYLNRIEEAKKRDHRKIGKDLELFTIKDEVGPGLVLWHPKGARIRHIIESFWKEEHYKSGYDLVYTPHIGKADLWEQSGHLGFYDEFMYAPMEIEEQRYFIKPMNCPFHIMMYKNTLHSYRDLPLRWAELGTVYRYEKSGVLHGLMRVRGFTQDDAHIICTPEQMNDEIEKTLQFCLSMLKAFGFDKFKVYLSTRPEGKCVGEEKRWDDAQKALQKSIKNTGLDFEIDEGGGAFYGPKIDIKIKDALDREWQCSTIQFDFNIPERFQMKYTGPDGAEHRPYMIHRALLGSIERFFGVLVEHYAGAFPLWLAPVQVKILTIKTESIEYAQTIAQKCKESGIRVDLDDRNEKIGLKIREAQLQKIPYMIIIGDKEVADNMLAVRHRKEGDLGTMNAADFLAKLTEEITAKR